MSTTDISKADLERAAEFIITEFHDEYNLDEQYFPIVVEKDRPYKLDYQSGNRHQYDSVEILSGPAFDIKIPKKIKISSSEVERFMSVYDNRFEDMTGLLALELLSSKKFIHALNREWQKEQELVGEVYARGKAEKYLGSNYREMIYYSNTGLMRSGSVTISYHLSKREWKRVMEKVIDRGLEIQVRKIRDRKALQELGRISKELLKARR